MVLWVGYIVNTDFIALTVASPNQHPRAVQIPSPLYTATATTMGKKKSRKISKNYSVKIKTRKGDASYIIRLYNERDIEALDSMGAWLVAVPGRMFKNADACKPRAFQDRRPWQKTIPKRASSLRKCRSSEGVVEDSSTIKV